MFYIFPPEETALTIVMSWAIKGNIENTPKIVKKRHAIKLIKFFPKDIEGTLAKSTHFGHKQCMFEVGDDPRVTVKY